MFKSKPKKSYYHCKCGTSTTRVNTHKMDKIKCHECGATVGQRYVEVIFLNAENFFKARKEVLKDCGLLTPEREAKLDAQLAAL